MGVITNGSTIFSNLSIKLIMKIKEKALSFLIMLFPLFYGRHENILRTNSVFFYFYTKTDLIELLILSELSLFYFFKKFFTLSGISLSKMK